MTSTSLITQAQDFCAQWQGNVFSPNSIAALRETDLLSHMADKSNQPHEIYRASFDLLHAIGALDLAAAVALTMHQYTVGTIATAHIADEQSRVKRDRFLDVICDKKLLCAVSSFDMTLRPDGSVKAGLNATMRDGHWIVSGRKRYQSMASVADILFFTAAISDRSFGLFYVSLKDNPRIVLGDTPVATFMRATDTRPVDFNEVDIPAHQLVSVTDLSTTTQFHAYSLSWFQSLIPAAYLGAARAALEMCTRKIADASSTGSAHRTLRHESDIGRMDLQLRSALALSNVVEAALAALHTKADARMAEFDEAAEAFKYTGTQVAASVVSQVRNIGGLALMVDDSPFAQISEYVSYGPLHPRPNSELEGVTGRSVLTIR
jgi:alkylation response protein AidB-like acyl-CoA dehydrogenase